jgi:hypothetical protein
MVRPSGLPPKTDKLDHNQPLRGPLPGQKTAFRKDSLHASDDSRCHATVEARGNLLRRQSWAVGLANLMASDNKNGMGWYSLGSLIGEHMLEGVSG